MTEASPLEKWRHLIIPLILGLAFWAWFFGYHHYLEVKDRKESIEAAKSYVAKRAASKASGQLGVTEPSYFRGDECVDDCSGHDAGYRWAQDNMISQDDDCSGESESFVEGCRAWVEDLQ